MDIFLNIVLPIVGFILAVIGAWDKLSIGLKYYKSKRAERIIRRAKKEIEKIEYYEGNTGHLVAYQFKQLFFLLTVIFFVSVIGLAPPDKIVGNELQVLFTAIFCWLAGFFVGNAVRVANYVLKSDKLKEKARRKIALHESCANVSFQPTTNTSAD